MKEAKNILLALLLPVLSLADDRFVRHYVTTDEGRVSYQVRRGNGPPVILIHGSFNANRQWEEVIGKLDPSLPLVLIELRGHGESWPPPANGSIEQFAQDVLLVARREKLERFYVGGHSIGGMIALEVGRVKASRVLGVFSIEGWTNHRAQADAFQNATDGTLTPEQQKMWQAARVQATGKWTTDQRKAFGAIWRRWDGTEFLRATALPVLEVYGDRGRPKPSLEQLHIPDRPNIRVHWIANASHSLPLEKPAELAATMQSFLDETRNARLMDSELASVDPTEIDQAPGRTSLVYGGKVDESQFNLHSYLAHFGGQFWAIWSSSKAREEDPDQHVKFASSKDGHHWSEPGVLAADPDGPSGPGRWIARGLFVVQGRLSALAAYIESADYRSRPKGEVVWKNLRLMRFEWEAGRWLERGLVAAGCMNNFPPARLSGRWMMPCRNERMNVFVAFSDNPDSGVWSRQTLAADPPFHQMDEPTWYEGPDGVIHLVIRDNSRSGYLIRVVSRDGGKTWSKPVLTNYPDATSKNFIGRLQDKRFFLINNSNPKRRDPLTISFSDDGWTFHQLRAIRLRANPRRFSGNPGISGSFQYPHAIEHGGSLWIIYSTNKEDIEITELPLKSLAALR